MTNIKNAYLVFLQISMLLCLLSFNVSLAQNKTEELIAIYNNRIEDIPASINKLEKIQQQNLSKNELLLLFSLKSLTQITNKNYDLAKKALEEAEKYQNDKINNIENAYFYFAKARYYDIYDISDKALSLFLKSYEIAKKKNLYSLASNVAVYIFYLSDKNNKYIDEAIILAEKSQDISEIINTRTAYANYLKFEKLKTNNPSITADALIEYFKETNDKIIDETKILNKYYLASFYFNYGYNLLVYKNDSQGNIYLKKALSIANKYNYQTIIRNYYGAKGSLFLENKKYAEAKVFYKKGIEEISLLPFVDPSTELLFYNDLKIIAEVETDWFTYYKLNKKTEELNQKINDETKNKAIQTAIAKYELKEKDEKIAMLSEQNKFKNYLIITIFTIVLLSATAFYFYVKSNKIKQIYFKQKEKQILAEKEQVQKELINSVLHLEKKNEILSEVKNKLLEQNKQSNNKIDISVFKTIDNALVIDEDFEKFKNNFNTIYPEFFNQLQEKSNNKLTQLDLKYCGFILMKLSNKEMAIQMNVEPKSIRMARYRIKIKLNLTKDDDLDTYIQSLS